VSGWTWPSRQSGIPPNPGMGREADGEENLRRSRHYRDPWSTHWHAGRNNRKIAQSQGVDRKTARKYIAAAEAAGMSAGGPPVTEERWTQLVRQSFPELSDTRLRQVTWPAIGAHHDYIDEQPKAGVTVATIHQRLRDERGLAVSVVASLRRCGGEPAGGDAPVAGQGAAAVAGRAGRRGAD